MDSIDLLNAIHGRLDELRAGTLTFWGHWFGKPYDNLHRIVGADVVDEALIVYFDHAETLIIDSPRDWSLEGGRLVVGDADRVRFQWFYYGRLPTVETLNHREYLKLGTEICFTAHDKTRYKPDLDCNSAAVELHIL